MKYRFATLLVGCIAAFTLIHSNPAAARTCDQEADLALWEQAEEAGIVTGYGMLNDTPTIQVPRELWPQFPLETRVGLALTLDCIIAGPGNTLRKIQIVDQGGRTLATWDGIAQELDVRE